MNKYIVVDLDHSQTVFENSTQALAFLRERKRKSYTTNVVTLPLTPAPITIHFIKVVA